MVASKFKKTTYLVLLLFGLGVLILYFFKEPSNTALFPKCPFYSFTGLYCPGCGSQRAIHQILHGNIIEGIRHNLLLLLLIVLLVYKAVIKLTSNYRIKSVENILHHPKTTYTVLVLIILFWIFRNIPMRPFSYLAP